MMNPSGTKFFGYKIVPQSDLREGTASDGIIKKEDTGANSYTAMKRKGLQQFQMESCQPTKRLKDENKKKRASDLFISSATSSLSIVVLHQRVRQPERTLH
jgi:hypothetical protein